MTILNTPDILPRTLWEQKHSPDAARMGRVVEAAKLFNDGTSGRNPYAKADLQEALTTSDFNNLLGAAFNIELLDNYKQLEPEWRTVAKEASVQDFRPKTYVDLFGGYGALDKVAEGEEYKERAKSDAKYTISAAKFGNTFKLTFELIKNDQLHGLKTLPTDLAAGAVATEDQAVFSAFISASGPNTAFFKSANGNAVDNKPLTRDNLTAAYVAISKRKDKNGLPYRANGKKLRLIVPVALEMAAELLVNTPVMPDPAGGNVSVPNPLYSKFEVHTSYWASVINTDAKADTTWYVLPAPDSVRPALLGAKMIGQENPDIRVKADTGSSLGGGNLPVEEGSFDDDTVTYRGRHIFGAGTLDPIATYASTGA